MIFGEAEQVAPFGAGGGSPKIGLATVVVPHLDDYENLDAGRALLQEQSFPSEQTEIIVADNGSSRGLDAVRRIVGKSRPGRRGCRRGAGPARNAGVRASRGEAIAFIDSDCRATAAGSKKALPNCSWRILPVGEWRSLSKIRSG